MAWPFLGAKKNLGIDIGTAALRVVELSEGTERVKLENYGEIQSKFLYGKPFRSLEKGVLSLSTQDIAQALRAVLDTAKIRTRIANFALPDFSSFFTTFQLPPMTETELAQAVKFEARQHVPLPVSEMALDWVLTEGKPSPKREESLKVLLVAVPNRIIDQYKEIARLAHLELRNLEAEVFALKRVLFGQEKEERAVALLDIGAASTTCSIVDKGVLKVSHSFDIAGDSFTKKLAETLELDLQTAERLKLKYGLLPQGQVIHKVLQPLADSVIMEVEKICRHFFQTEGKEVEGVVLAGGMANLKGMREYFREKMGKEVTIGYPFAKISYPPILEKTLRESGPSFAVAAGMALGGLQ